LVTAIVHAAFPTRVTNRFQDCTHLDRIPIGNHSEHPFQRSDFERCLKSSVPASIMVTSSGVSVLITSHLWLNAANQTNPLFTTPLRVIKSGKRIGGCRLEPDHFVKRHLTPVIRKLGLGRADVTASGMATPVRSIIQGRRCECGEDRLVAGL